MNKRLDKIMNIIDEMIVFLLMIINKIDFILYIWYILIKEMNYLDNKLLPSVIAKEINKDEKILILNNKNGYNVYSGLPEKKFVPRKKQVFPLDVKCAWLSFNPNDSIYIQSPLLKHFKTMIINKANKSFVGTFVYQDGEFKLNGKEIKPESIKFCKKIYKKEGKRRVVDESKKTEEFKYLAFYIEQNRICLAVNDLSSFEIKLILITSKLESLEFIKIYRDIFSKYIQNKSYIIEDFDKRNVIKSSGLTSLSTYSSTYSLGKSDITDDEKKYFISDDNIILNDFIERQKDFTTLYYQKYDLFMIDYFKQVPYFIGNQGLTDIYWLDSKVKKYLVTPPETYNKILVNAGSFKNIIMNILGESLYKMIKGHSLYITGSIISAILTGNYEKKGFYHDVDIFTDSSNLSKIVIELVADTKEKYTLSHEGVDRYIFKSDKIQIEIFKIKGNPIRFTESFHLPIVKTFYDVSNDKLWCHQSFMRALLTKTNYITADSFFISNKTTKNEIFLKYLNRGFGLLCNDYEKKHLEIIFKDKKFIYSEVQKLPKISIIGDDTYINSTYVVVDTKQKLKKNKKKEIIKFKKKMTNLSIPKGQPLPDILEMLASSPKK
jgi:hypothetical protein